MDKFSLMDHLGFTRGQCRVVSKRPIYSGNVALIIRKKNCVQHRTTIFMKLFEQCPNHYAVLYRNDDCEFQYGFFDYRNCIVRPVTGNACQFDVTKTDADTGLRFEASSSELAEKNEKFEKKWINNLDKCKFITLGVTMVNKELASLSLQHCK